MYLLAWEPYSIPVTKAGRITLVMMALRMIRMMSSDCIVRVKRIYIQPGGWVAEGGTPLSPVLPVDQYS